MIHMPARLLTSLYLSVVTLAGIAQVVVFFMPTDSVVKNIVHGRDSASPDFECNILSDISQAVDSIRESAANIKKFADSLSQFFETVGSVISFIGSLIGAKALLLLAGAMIFSGLLSTIGLPRGKLSFFISLGFADFIWAAWRKSFEGVDSPFIWEMVKANLILIAPFLVIHLTKRYYPSLKQKLARMFGRIIGKKKGMAVDEALSFWERYKAAQNDFERALMDDIVAGGENGVIVSDETKRCLMEMQQLFESITEGARHPKK